MPALFEAIVRSLTPLATNRVDQPLGDSAQAEPARGNGHAVEQHAFERALGIGIDFLHLAAPEAQLRKVEPTFNFAGPA